MPRGRIRLSAKSPDDDRWRTTPEVVAAELAEASNARYIDGSLIFTQNGRIAELLVETFEGATDFLKLGKSLDAFEISLFISPDVWVERFGPEDEGAER